MDSRNHELNKMDDTTSYQPETPKLCANGCGFFGSSATHNLCSKCYEDYLKEQLAKSAAKVICVEKPMSSSTVSVCDRSGLVSSINKLSVCPDHEGTVKNSNAATTVGDSTAKKRCECCKKRVGLTGFECRCGGMFCGMHRYPETHSCTFDYKTAGRVALAKQNPLCAGDKLKKRI